MRPSVVQIHASCSIPRALLKRHCSRPSGICIFWGSHQTDPTGPQPSRLWSLCDVTVSTLCPPPGSLGSKDRCRDVTFYRKTPIFGHLKHCVPLGCICEISLWGRVNTRATWSHQNSWQMDLHPSPSSIFCA